MIKKDLHVHLHGCLSAEDLWNIGKDNYKQQDGMLNWFALEYQKAWGRTPNFKQYWESENGYDLLREDYIFDKTNNFDRFQANFNLIVALCPIGAENFDIQERIIRNTDKEKLEYFEARTLIPFRLDEKQVEKYLQGLCLKVKELNAGLNMQTRLVFSLFRDNGLALKHYKQLRDFIASYPDLGSVISGVDFAFAEEGSPPKSKIEFCKQFHLDNKSQQPLNLLYHVGESFEDKGIISAIRWIWEAHELGATRLGHAIALGVNPENYHGKKVSEPISERLDTINWLMANQEILKENGYTPDVVNLRKEEQTINDLGSSSIDITYDDSYVEDCKSLQIAIANIFREKRVIIETCPTSNLRIGQVTKPSFHPLKFFHDHGLQYVTCTDDPGIFNIDWHSEYRLAQEIIETI